MRGHSHRVSAYAVALARVGARAGRPRNWYT